MSKAVAPMRVLVVDDDREICDFMETFLSKDGVDVKTVSDPESASEEVKNGGYHLVVLDLMMPKLDGVEVLSRIRKVDS
ncbi:MAG TPA: response regulator, partial [Polyangiales bacterium]|nr:response regulator [Polyangiales bacterium]